MMPLFIFSRQPVFPVLLSGYYEHHNSSFLRGEVKARPNACTIASTAKVDFRFVPDSSSSRSASFVPYLPCSAIDRE
jgi:hypothetical protein